MSKLEGISAWIRVQMSSQKYVTQLEIKSTCAIYLDSRVKEVKMEFDDLSFQMVIR